MYCLTVLYPAPDDADAFKEYYVEKHLPLAAKLPGMIRSQYAFPKQLGPGEAPFCIFQAYFPDPKAMETALVSEAGQKVAGDVPNYSPKGASLCHFTVNEG